MSFFILFGKQDYDSKFQVNDPNVLPSIKDINRKPAICNEHAYYCPNCKNLTVEPIKRKEFITIFFIPVVPLYWGKQLHCTVCNWRQDFSNEQELQKVKYETINMLS
ncbi:hypothetical protein ACO0SA_003434 [Hanseniaspora valbyensis]